MTDALLALARTTPGAVWVCPTVDRVAAVRRRLAAVPCLAPPVVTPDALPPAPRLVVLDGVSRSHPAIAALPEGTDIRLSPPGGHAPTVGRIEAAGTVGEARLVARHVRRLLLAGAAPSAVVVTGRGLDRAVLTAALAAHAVPAAWAEPEPLARHPAVAFLLAAWALPADDFAFPRLAAVLRSTWLAPDWPECDAPDLPARAEGLLRAVGVPRGRDAYLRAVGGWAEAPPPALEDETGDEPRRQRLHRLAGRCRPFLRRFFRLWDRPGRSARDLRRFAADIGLSPQAEADPLLAPGWAAWWAAVDALPARRPDPPAFAARLRALAAGTPQPPPAVPGDAVRVLPPEAARFAACDHLVLANLSEGTFPHPDRDPYAEQELFDALVTRPRLTLTLSRAAVGDGGDDLLPATALADFVAGRDLPAERQRMRIEGYGTGEPHTAAELRVRAARALHRGAALAGWPLPAAVAESLGAARAMAAARHREPGFGRFDGQLRHPQVLADLRTRFGPQRVFSPTALEAYIACPFRFWVEHVLRLEPLDDPAEEVERTRRGAAVHRALARLHAGAPPADPGAELTAALATAVGEYAHRAASAVGRALWEVEGRRLHRLGGKYARHWDQFRELWAKQKASPGPYKVEADFGLPPADPAAEPLPPLLVAGPNGEEVRIGGRIDRVDVAEHGGRAGFWVIDYKTGRRENYPASALAEFRKVQLPLYALAVERVLLAGRPSRPLGLAYWLVADGGCRTVLPKQAVGWAGDEAGWRAYAGVLETWVLDVVRHLRAGDFPLAPRSDRCTETCRFGPTCRIGSSRSAGKRFALPLPVVEAPPGGE